MSNTIKYSEGSESLALNKGNWWVGTGDTNKGPSDVTGYYAGVTPPSSGYTIYIKREDNLPSIFVAQNDQELIFLTNQISESNFTTTQECLNYFQSQDDKLCVSQEFPLNFPYIVIDGLSLYLDTKFSQSYNVGNNTWYNISGLGYKNNGTIINSPVYTSDYDGIFLLDGTNDYFTVSGVTTGTTWSAFIWFYYDGQTVFANRGHRTFFATSTFRYQWDDNSSPTIGRGPFIRFTIDSGGLAAWYLDITPDELFNQWHFVGITSDGTTIKNYFDGYQRGTNFNVTRQFSIDGNMRLAYDGISGIGSIDYLYEAGGDTYVGPFLMYNRGLSDSEVLQNYNAQKGRFGL